MTPDRSTTRALVRAILAAAIAVLVLLGAALAAAAQSPAGPGAAPPSAAPGGSGAVPGSGGPAASGGTQISIIQKTFQPADVTIPAGATVTWTVTQAIDQPHSVTAGNYKTPNPSQFDSGVTLKSNGDTFSHTFDTPGTYSYFCQVHPDTMTGTITVTAAGGAGGASGAGSEGAVSTSDKLIAGAILVVAILLFFGWAALYRRMNPAV